jgi:SHS2 domain-containing protein
MAAHQFEEIEHTADWAIRVHARDWPGLFAGAAEGMFSLVADLPRVAADRAFDIELQTLDVETLLIDWLNELLYLAEAHGIVFREFSIRELVVNGSAHLRAEARGGRPEALFKVIKAATFSGLSITRDGDGLAVDLVFDV